MELNVQISPEQINAAVTEAIIKSSIGKALQDVIDAEVKKLTTSYNNPLAPVVNRHIHDSIDSLIRTQYADQIKAFVAEKMTDKFTAELMDKLWNSFVNR